MNRAVASLSNEFDEGSAIELLDRDNEAEKKDVPEKKDDNTTGIYRLASHHPDDNRQKPTSSTTIPTTTTGILPLTSSFLSVRQPLPQKTLSTSYGNVCTPPRNSPNRPSHKRSSATTHRDLQMEIRQCGNKSSSNHNTDCDTPIGIDIEPAAANTDDDDDHDDDKMEPPKFVRDDHIIEKDDDNNKKVWIATNLGNAPDFSANEHVQEVEREQSSNNHNDENDQTVNEEKKEEERKESVLWRSRLRVGRIVNHEYVQITVIVFILINALMMGIGTMNWVTDSPKIDNVFTMIDQTFLVIFTLEVSMQLYYLGLALFHDGWLVFDLAIVVLSWSFESWQIVRAFRIFRAFRLITKIKPLRDLVLAIGAVLPRIYAIAGLLMIIFYVFAVLFTELFSNLPLSENYFRTLDASLFTCMEMMTLTWADIAREVIEYHTWAWAPFVFFIAISGFIVYNLIVAVVVEAVAVTEQTVRALDGMETNTPSAKLEEAEERMDLLRQHLEGMMQTQKQIQFMLDVMTSELVNLETKQMNVGESEKFLLRTKVNNQMEYERAMQLEQQIDALEHEKGESVRQERMQLQHQKSRELLTSMEDVSLDRLQRPLHNQELSSLFPRSSRNGRSGSKRLTVSQEVGSGHGSLKSLNTKTVSSRTVGSTVDEERQL
jgi:hypothetical protein